MLTAQDICALERALAKASAQRKGAPVEAIATYQGTGDKISAPIDLRGHNAVQVQVLIGSGTNVSADLHVQGSYTTGGFADLPDPNAVLKSISAPLIVDVPCGCNYLAVKLANLTGSFGANQGWTVIVTPYDSPGVRQRTSYYDRNPSAVTGSYIVDIGAQSSSPTTVFTYTVPSNRRAFLSSARAGVMRRASATSYGEMVARISYLPLGKFEAPLVQAVVVSNEEGDESHEAISQAGVFSPGDQIFGEVFDMSTGGTGGWWLSMTLTEFDL